MSFDVFLQRFRNGESADAPRATVRNVLAREKYQGPDDFGFYLVTFSDGTEVEFSAGGLDSDKPFCGCAFHIRGFSGELAKFIFDVATAGDMVILPAMEDRLVILANKDQEHHLQPDIREDFKPVVVENGDELRALLSGGFRGWEAYRNHVVSREGWKERL